MKIFFGKKRANFFSKNILLHKIDLNKILLHVLLQKYYSEYYTALFSHHISVPLASKIAIS